MMTTYKASKKFEIAKTNTKAELGFSKKELEKKLEKSRKKLGELQNALYAHGKHAVLVCLQGMDTAGKDSLIREVFKDFNSSGIAVHSFKVPSTREKNQDYLWRHYLVLPQKGTFGVFNRTHYENVLVTKVHPEYILNENIPGISKIEAIDENFWKQRYRQINDFERHLSENGTLILKFFLHISKEEQKYRLLRRLKRPEKNWKFSPADLAERKLWKAYQSAYQEAIKNTSTDYAPWYVIPSDSKPEARLLVCETLRKVLKNHTPSHPPQLDAETMKNLGTYIKHLEQEK